MFTVFCLIVGCLCLRLYVLCDSGTELVSSDSHYSRFELYRVRGKILDRNGKNFTDTECENYVISKPSAEALSKLSEILDSKTHSEIRAKAEKGLPLKVCIGRTYVESSDTLLCLPIYKRYSTNQLAQHIIGYVGSDFHGLDGIEKAFDDVLYSDSSVSVRVPVDAQGRSINGGKIELLGASENAGTVKLTIDREIQSVVEKAMDNGGIVEGCAVAVDVKSGAILAMASRPSYDAYRIYDFTDSDSSPLLNRALQSFAVGSIFKTAVAAAAIENELSDFRCECTGTCKIGDVTFGCSNHKAHGTVDIKKGLEVSCNTYFIKLGQKLGAKALSETIGLLGFGEENKLADTLTSDSGVIPSLDELASPAALANFSFGQGKFTASPLQIAQMLCAVANSGKYCKPYLVEAVNGEKTAGKTNFPITAMSEKTAAKLLTLLASVVENGSGTSAHPKNFSAAGKTATAQTGIFDKNGIELCNTWFGGIFPAENPQYVVVIMKQNGVSGASDCAPIFKEIADNINISEKN